MENLHDNNKIFDKMECVKGGHGREGYYYVEFSIYNK